MTVQDLITALSAIDPNLEVLYPTDHDGLLPVGCFLATVSAGYSNARDVVIFNDPADTRNTMTLNCENESITVTLKAPLPNP